MRGMAPQWKAKKMFKKSILAGLMAATVLGGIAPAYAQRGDDNGWRGRGERSGRAEAGRGDGDWQRGQRGGEAPQQAEQQRWEQRAERPAPRVEQPRVERQWRGGGDAADNGRHEDWRNRARVVEGQRSERPQWRDERRNDDRPVVRDDRRFNERRDWRDDRHDNRWSGNDRRWDRNAGVTRRFDDRTRWAGQRRWDSGWRQDRRYDWSSYRSRYGDRYRMGRYYAPRGWDYGYTRFSIGIYLNSLLFADDYWIDDPYAYRLPPAYGTLRWVRYYDDALLVDIRDGYVVDVIHDFFW